MPDCHSILFPAKQENFAYQKNTIERNDEIKRKDKQENILHSLFVHSHYNYLIYLYIELESDSISV